MNPPRRRLLGLAASAAVLPLASGVRAQAYPSRPISMIVPASAGGPTDAIGRVLAERIGALLGDSAARTRMGAAGRAWTLEMFTWDRVIARMLACYAQVLAWSSTGQRSGASPDSLLRNGID